ncbi:YafY family transcriptional regulator [Flavobacteriaceae bacterium TP-CH-4]|uniref:YafY family transcriptional regulator n=1 Tax=Pelagihabitans pacificus TaxID=2696054 RepID=A0A967E6N3_9FLAO|nr:YafY family protein [Pelagihabitans pacificus]NHF60707.1 YafY family transcriptional regulator [Pelagihabitans pacificus]
MKRLHRLTAILTKLQSKTSLRANEMATDFDVSVRTIYRDLEALSEAGVPIGYENSEGYFLVDGYQLPPIMFTEEEAHAMLTAKKIVSQNNDSSFIGAYGKAMQKVTAVLRTSQKKELQLLEERISPSTAKTIEKSSSSVSLIQQAIAKRTVLRLRYRSGSKGEITERDVEPMAVYFTQDHWVMIAYCRLRTALREFRTDRIQSVIETSDSFPPNQFTLSDYFEKNPGF